MGDVHHPFRVFYGVADGDFKSFHDEIFDDGLFGGEKMPSGEVSTDFFALFSEDFRGVVIRIHRDGDQVGVPFSFYHAVLYRFDRLHHFRADGLATGEKEACDP